LSAHRGRCFRAWRSTQRRKHKQGKPWVFPIRQKLPRELRPFFFGNANQVRVTPEAMYMTLSRYAQANMSRFVRRGAARGQ
jgi:hypothetical protein